MTFVVATGLELGAADSYVSVAAADGYFEALQDPDWDPIDTDKKMMLLRRASTVINQRYRWLAPEDYTSVPRAVQIATYELAKHWSISASPTVAEGQKIKQVQVGSIGVTFADPSISTSSTPDQIYAFLDMILSKIGVPAYTSTTTGGAWGLVPVSRA